MNDFLKDEKGLSKIITIIIAVLITGAVVGGTAVYLNRRKSTSVENTPSPTPSPAQTESFEAKFSVYVSEKEGLNLREDKSLESEILLTMPYRAKIDVLAEEDDWCLGVYQGSEGWFKKEFTSKEEPPEISEKDQFLTKLKNTLETKDNPVLPIVIYSEGFTYARYQTGGGLDKSLDEAVEIIKKDLENSSVHVYTEEDGSNKLPEGISADFMAKGFEKFYVIYSSGWESQTGTLFDGFLWVVEDENGIWWRGILQVVK